MNKEGFEKRLKLDREKMKYLSFVDTDTKRYITMFDKLEADIIKKDKETRKKYDSPLVELMLENLYKNAYMRLKLIECEYANNNEYLDTCLLIEKISTIVNCENIDKNELNDLVDRVIEVIKSNYSFDDKTLNTLYSICFKLMQLEVEYNSKSKILMYSKNDKKLRTYMKKRLEEEILVSDKISPSECDTAKEIINSNNNEIVNEENISEVTNDNIKAEVMSELKGFLRQIGKNNEEIEKIPKKKSKRNPVAVSAVTCASILAVALTVVKVAHDNSVSHEYLTNKTTIISETTTQEDKYMPKIDNGYQELVVESYPWKNLKTGNVVKKEISYDVTGSGINEDNYEDANLADFEQTVSERQSSSSSYNVNFNNGIVRKFVTLTQDSSNEKTRFDGLTFYIYMFLGSMSGIFGLLVAGSIYECVTKEYILDSVKETYRRIKNGEVTLEEEERVEKYSKKYLKLIEENEEIKKRFMEKYNKYCEIVNLDELKEEYNRVIK